MSYDKPLVAVTIGFLATVPYEIFTRIFLLFGVGKYSEYQLSSLIVTIDRPSAIMGFFVSSILGGGSTLLFYYALKRIGSDYLIIKSTLTGVITFLFLETIFTWLIEGRNLIPLRPISDYFIHMFGASIFGLTMGLLLKKYMLKQRTSILTTNR